MDRKKSAEASARYEAKMTPEQKEARRKRLRDRYQSDKEYREKVKARAKGEWDAMSPEERLARGRAKRNAVPKEERRARALRYRTKLRTEVLNGYGGKCECCGNTRVFHLTIDHIDGGGGAERRSSRGNNLYRRLRREGFPPGYRVLCWNCNWEAHASGSHRCSCSD